MTTVHVVVNKHSFDQMYPWNKEILEFYSTEGEVMGIGAWSFVTRSESVMFLQISQWNKVAQPATFVKWMSLKTNFKH